MTDQEQLTLLLSEMRSMKSELIIRIESTEKSIRSDIAEFRTEVSSNYVAIGDTITQAIEETEKRLTKEISDMKHAVAQNSYDIAVVRGKSS